MSIFAYPVYLDNNGEIVIDDDRELKRILKVGVWKGKNVMFYEEKPMFIVVSLIDQSLGQTRLCQTLEDAVDAGIAMAENWQIDELESNDMEIRECLYNNQEYHFADLEHDYAVFIGQPEWN